MTILTMAIADAIAIAALCTLYMVRHRNRELMISYAVINAGIFTVSVALVSAGSNASAMGMGLFGVLSIIRLRSTALSQREVGYYFVALSVGMIAGVNISPAYIAFGSWLPWSASSRFSTRAAPRSLPIRLRPLPPIVQSATRKSSRHT